MANKQEWIEYFELMHHRQPTADEILAAIEEGDISLSHSKVANSATTQRELSQDVNHAYSTAKHHAGNYFVWLKDRMMMPSKHAMLDEQFSVTFLWITYALASLVAALTVWNFCRRIVNAAVATVGSFTGTSDSLVHAASQYLTSGLLMLWITFALIYFAGVPILAWTTKVTYRFYDALMRYLNWFAIVLGINIVAFIASFLIPITPSTLNSLDNMDSAIYFLMATVGLVTFLLTLSSSILAIGQFTLVNAANKLEGKVDTLWWQLCQQVGTGILSYLIIRFIVAPMFKSLFAGLDF